MGGRRGGWEGGEGVRGSEESIISSVSSSQHEDVLKAFKAAKVEGRRREGGGRWRGGRGGEGGGRVGGRGVEGREARERELGG